jgi:hypothetical protein
VTDLVGGVGTRLGTKPPKSQNQSQEPLRPGGAPSRAQIPLGGPKKPKKPLSNPRERQKKIKLWEGWSGFKVQEPGARDRTALLAESRRVGAGGRAESSGLRAPP